MTRRRRHGGRPPIDARFVEELQRLPRELSFAEAWRAMLPLSQQLGIPRPSYHLVREIRIELGLAARKQAEALDAIVPKLLRSRPLTPGDLILVQEAHRARTRARRRRRA